MAKVLKRAEKIAQENRDAELLVAISDRWYALSEGAIDEEEHKLTIGFIDQEKDNDERKTSHKRKS